MIGALVLNELNFTPVQPTNLCTCMDDRFNNALPVAF